MKSKITALSIISIGVIFLPFITHASVGETFSFIKYILLEGIALIVAILALGVFFIRLVWKLHAKWMAVAMGVFGLSIMVFYATSVGLPSGLQYPPLKGSFGPPGHGPGLPLGNVFAFFQHLDEFERVPDIARDPSDVPPAPTNTESEVVEITQKLVDKYRNIGGFSMIKTGRTKIDSSQKMTLSKDTCKRLNLQALVVVGGDDSNTNAAFMAQEMFDDGIQIIAEPGRFMVATAY